MEYAKTLIDNAVKACKPQSRYELVKRLRAQGIKITEQNLSAVYGEKRGFPVEWAAPMATIAGMEPGHAVLRILAERAGGKSHLGSMAAAIGGAATLLFSYGSSVFQTPGNLTIATAMVDLLRIVSRKRRPVYQGANPA